MSAARPAAALNAAFTSPFAISDVKSSTRPCHCCAVM
jgi:hypothetical protein